MIVMYVVLLLLFLIGFNFTYFANSGLMISGLTTCKTITFKNATLSTPNSNPLSSFAMDKLLTLEECNMFSERIKSHESFWERRNVAMSTLGTASYLDGANKNLYITKSIESNKFMEGNYSDLLDLVLNYFKFRCPNSNIEFRTNAALPGFHIFDCNKIFSHNVASVHKDMQFNRLTYLKNEELDEKNTLSFTLALELPQDGGGLYTFEDEISSLLIPKPVTYSFSKKTKIEYKEGYIVCHNGLTFHMIAPCKESKRKRITFQGHGIFIKNFNTWYIYW